MRCGILAWVASRPPALSGATPTRLLSDALLSDAELADAYVVEPAPGLGRTAAEIVAIGPASYVGIEQDEKASRIVSGIVDGHGRCRTANATNTGLPRASADVVVKVNARPPAVAEWRALFEDTGLQVEHVRMGVMGLLHVRRNLAGERARHPADRPACCVMPTRAVG